MRSEGLLDEPTTFALHAGKDYYGELLPKLEGVDTIDVEISTEGLAIDEKLAWYGDRIDQ